MTITGVDFHMKDDQGRLLALVESAQLEQLHLGDLVLVEDFEGNRVKAEFAEILPKKELVCLVPQRGTFDPSSKADWLGGAINY